jgi:hypothetical protein
MVERQGSMSQESSERDFWRKGSLHGYAPRGCHLDRARRREATECEWRDPDDVCTTMPIQGVLPRLCASQFWGEHLLSASWSQHSRDLSTPRRRLCWEQWRGGAPVEMTAAVGESPRRTYVSVRVTQNLSSCRVRRILLCEAEDEWRDPEVGPRQAWDSQRAVFAWWVRGAVLACSGERTRPLPCVPG